MLLSLVPAMGVTASAAEWTTVNSFEELQEAVKNKQEHIKLGKDIDTRLMNSSTGMLDHDRLNFEGRNTVLDLNGNILKLQTEDNKVYSFIYLANGSLTIKDSGSVKRDEISGSFGSTAGSCDYRTIFVGENGNLTLEGGTFRVGGNPYPTTTEAIYCRGGSVTVKDGVTISQLWFHDGCYARDLDGSGYALHTEGKSKAIIAGGVFYGHVKLSGYQDTNGSVQISGGTSRYTVSFESNGGTYVEHEFFVNGGSKVSNQTVTRNSVMKEPTAPTKENFDFDGWYSDNELKTKYDFSEKVTKNFTLYAKWTEKDNSINQIILTIGKKDAQVFGQIKTNDVAPKIVNDRTYTPIRFISENLGASVEWVEKDQKVIITKPEIKKAETK